VLPIEAPRKLDLPLEDFLVDRHRVLVREGVDPGDHLVREDAQRPPVDRLAVPLVEQDLWCQVFRGPAEGVGSSVHHLSKPEISQF
jgi:hypothetical protein